MKRRGFIAALAALPAAIAGAAKASVTKKPVPKAEPYAVGVDWSRDQVECTKHSTWRFASAPDGDTDYYEKLWRQMIEDLPKWRHKFARWDKIAG